MTEGEAKLIRMAEEIHQFFRHQGDTAPAAAADHIRQFWAPVMRQEFLAAISEAQESISPTIREIAGELER